MFQLVLHVVIGLLPGTCEQIGPKASNRGRLSGNIQQLYEIVLNKTDLLKCFDELVWPNKPFKYSLKDDFQSLKDN